MFDVTLFEVMVIPSNMVRPLLTCDLPAPIRDIARPDDARG
jgi:hypothetical protein